MLIILFITRQNELKAVYVVLVKNSLGRDLEQRTNCCIAQNLSSNYTVRLKISSMMNVCVMWVW